MTCVYCHELVYLVQSPSGRQFLVDHRGRVRCWGRPGAGVTLRPVMQ